MSHTIMIAFAFFVSELWPFDCVCNLILCNLHSCTLHTSPGCIAQSVKCLVTDGHLTADPGVMSLILARSHIFVEIDHEIISTVILLPSAESPRKNCD